MWQLGERSLWVDEFGTYQMIQGSVLDAINSAASDIHPPLYFALLNIWTGLVGTSDFALRWLSIAAGLAAVALMPVFLRELRMGSAIVPAALLLSTSPALIEFSRMTRYYSLVAALGLASSILLLRAMRLRKRSAWLAYSVSVAALACTFYPSVLLVAAHGLLARSQWRAWLLSGMAGAVFCAPWIVFAVDRQIVRVAGSEGVDFARSLSGMTLAVAAGAYTFSVGESIFPWRPEAWLALLLVAFLVVRALNRRTPTNWVIFGALAACVGGMALLTTYFAAGTPFINVPVRALFALPFLTILVAAGLRTISSVRWQAAMLTLLLIVAGVSAYNNFAGREYLNPIYLTPSKEAASYVREQTEPGDIVISDFDSVFARYYITSATAARHLYTQQVDDIARAVALSRPPRVWLVVLGRDYTERLAVAPQVRTLLLASYRKVHVEKFLLIDPVYLQLKNVLLRRDSYEYRLSVELYEHNGP